MVYEEEAAVDDIYALAVGLHPADQRGDFWLSAAVR
jgi:hypothetical protein